MLDSFVGNDTVKSRIADMTASGRIPHAIILEGEEGTGKRTTAKYIAKSAVCSSEHRPCNECSGCRSFDNGSNIDIKYVKNEKTDKKTIGVDIIREVRADAFVMPNQSPKRVFIIEKADTMTEEAQNALLKVLEEPPSYVIFLLITPSVTSLLTTIRSRCAVFSLTSPTIEQATDYFLKTTKKEKSDIESAVMSANGNIGKAKKILKSGISKAEQAAIDLINQTANGNSFDMLKTCLYFEKSRSDALLLLNHIKQNLVGLLTDKSTGKAISVAFTIRNILKLIEITENAIAELEAYSNVSLTISNLCACFKSATAL